MKPNYGGHEHEHGTETPDVSHIRNVEVTHEMSDVDVKGILTFVVGLTVMTIAVYLLMLLMFNVLNKQEETKDKARPRSPMALTDKERLPPDPKLQAAPGFGVDLRNGQRVDLSLRAPQEEYEVLHRQWEEVLQQGPKDARGKVVGLPIDQAMKQIVEGNGLPSRSLEGSSPGSSSFSDYATQTPTAASSGRVTEKRQQ